MNSVRTPIGVLSFPVLFSPKPRAPGGEAVYQCSLLFDKNAQGDPAYASLRRGVLEAIDDQFGQGKSADKAFMAGLRSPFRKTSEKAYSGYSDMVDGIFISAWTKSKPGVVDARLNEIMVPSDVYAGQSARATVTPFAYNTSGNRGVSFMLNNIQIVKDGPRLDGRKAAKDDFDSLDGADVMAAADDEIPF